MKFRYAIALVTASLAVAAFAPAATLTVTARNLTTGKPAAGDQVVLLSLESGMAEIGRGKTDGGGGFRFTVADKQAPRLVRVVHDGVAYHKIAPPGVRSVRVEVYDAAATLERVIETRHVQRFQTDGGMLQVIEEISVRNASEPPRTLVNDRPYQLQLPPGAEIVAGAIRPPGLQALARRPTPVDGQEGRYFFDFPLRPGETRFAIAYRLPYSGEATIQPKLLYPAQHYVVVLPTSMGFEAKTAAAFRAIPDRGGASVRVASAVKAGQLMAFRISGTGKMAGTRNARQSAPGRQGGQERAGGGGTEGRDGSVPAAGPSPQVPDVDRWFFLSGLALILAAGAAGAVRAHRHSRARTQRVSTLRSRNHTLGTERETAGFAPQSEATRRAG